MVVTLKEVMMTNILTGILKQDYLRVVELYSGAGGMSLGFLTAGNLNYSFPMLSAFY